LAKARSEPNFVAVGMAASSANAATEVRSTRVTDMGSLLPQPSCDPRLDGGCLTRRRRWGENGDVRRRSYAAGNDLAIEVVLRGRAMS
jgi:hypothetical protein